MSESDSTSDDKLSQKHDGQYIILDSLALAVELRVKIGRGVGFGVGVGVGHGLRVGIAVGLGAGVGVGYSMHDFGFNLNDYCSEYISAASRDEND